MSIFCLHSWSPYHATEILEFQGGRRHTRLFEACQKCGAKRQLDFLPGRSGDVELRDHLRQSEAT